MTASLEDSSLGFGRRCFDRALHISTRQRVRALPVLCNIVKLCRFCGGLSRWASGCTASAYVARTYVAHRGSNAELFPRD